LHVERIDAESLDRVDEEENAPLAAKVAQRIEIIAKTAGELDEAEAQDARVRVHGGAEVVDQEPALAARHTPHLDAAIFQLQPRIDIGRVFLLGDDELDALLPRIAFA